MDAGGGGEAPRAQAQGGGRAQGAGGAAAEPAGDAQGRCRADTLPGETAPIGLQAPSLKPLYNLKGGELSFGGNINASA